jgi:hypothetical protein
MGQETKSFFQNFGNALCAEDGVTGVNFFLPSFWEFSYGWALISLRLF